MLEIRRQAGIKFDGIFIPGDSDIFLRIVSKSKNYRVSYLSRAVGCGFLVCIPSMRVRR